MENERELLRITRIDGMARLHTNCESVEDIFYIASAIFDICLKSSAIRHTLNSFIQAYSDDPNFRQKCEDMRLECPDLVNLLKNQAQ